MSGGLSADERASKEEQLRDLSRHLRDLSVSTAGAGHVDAIVGFADQADSYADRLHNAPSPEAAAAIAIEAERKHEQWTQLLDLLVLATDIEHIEDVDPAVLQEAEAKLRHTATSLRAVADTGTSAVFAAIGTIASQAEAGLAEFIAAGSATEKLQVYTRVEESRARWAAEMEDLHSTVTDGSESQAPTEAPDASDAAYEYDDDAAEDSSYKGVTEYVKDAASDSGCRTLPAGTGSGYYNYFPATGCAVVPSAASSAGCSVVSSPPAATESSAASTSTPFTLSLPTEGQDLSAKEVREQLVICLSDKDEGVLATLRAAVTKVKEDERFQGVHEDASKLLEQMELAAGAIIPEALVQEFSDDLAGAEDKLKATVEPMRKAQWGGFYAKKAAFAVQKYDLYVAKGKMPKLKDQHSELLECAKACVGLAEFLRKEAQGAIMDTVTGLVAQTMPSSS